MANSKFKCSCCKDFFPQEQKVKTNLGSFCSMDCAYKKKSKNQSAALRKEKERKGCAPTLEQERGWLSQINSFVSNYGSFPKGSPQSVKWQHHHIFGRKARHAGKEIGRWAVLPIEFKYHDISSNNECNVTNFPKRYADKFGSEIQQFLRMCEAIERDQGRLEIPREIVETIAEMA